MIRLYNYVVPSSSEILRSHSEMIKWEHSIFALPFALCGAMLAAGGLPAWRQLAWIVVAMVSARSAAMAFNRLADASIDASQSPHRDACSSARTIDARVCERRLSSISCGIFVLAAWQLNRLTCVLSPVALGGDSSVFLHQAIYALVASVAGIRPRHCARLPRGSRCAARSIRASCCLPPR